jgi:hypothetical protein
MWPCILLFWVIAVCNLYLRPAFLRNVGSHADYMALFNYRYEKLKSFIYVSVY